MQILLVTPPLTQLNTPYPATPHLMGMLRAWGQDTEQADLSIELALKLFSRSGIQAVHSVITSRASTREESIVHFLKNKEAYLETVEPAVRFLQGKDSSLAWRMVQSGFLPEGPRFRQALQADFQEDGFSWAFGALGIQDRAKFLASLYLDDLVDVIQLGVDARFGFSRYAEKLSASVSSFSPIQEALEGEPSLIDRMIDELAETTLRRVKPELLLLTLPFPGNVYGAFRIARVAKRLFPEIHVVIGGGYVSTEFRSLTEPRVFDYVDSVCLDDGEKPLRALISKREGKSVALIRTFQRENGKVVFYSDPSPLEQADRVTKEIETPVFEGLPLDSYISLLEMLNPMHRLWSDGRWNKLAVARGCYWAKCSFCDTSLDYIRCYQPFDADRLVDRIEAMIRETGQTGFHFVDEAAPPAVLRALAERLVSRGVVISWWANIRFEKAFNPTLCRLLVRSGCLAVTGGLEAASDRLLKFVNKGVSIAQAARVTRAFSEAGIMVHAYLMYGLPGQTEQETVDSLDVVRQLFEAGCIQSAFWHRFSVTAHSPIGMDPQKYGIRILSVLNDASLQKGEPVFARNDLPFEDTQGCDSSKMTAGLNAAVYNYMHGMAFEKDVHRWFSETGVRVPKSKVPRRRIAQLFE